MATVSRAFWPAALEVEEQEFRELLVSQLGLVDDAAFDKCRALSRTLRVPLLTTLLERTRIPPAFVLQHLAGAWGVKFIDLKVGQIDRAALSVLSEEYARAHALLAFRREERQLHVAMVDPRCPGRIDDIERMTNLRVIPYLAPDSAIRRGQLAYKGDIREMLETAAADETLRVGRADGRPADEHFAARLVDRILEYAVVTYASDVHIEPYDLEVLVRYRIDGALHEVLTLPPGALPSLVSRIKILSGMRIDERRVPQDGRFVADPGGVAIDLRVSSMPTRCGEKIVMRVLARDRTHVDLEELGLAPADYPVVLQAALRPFGMVLVTGPTGSGKTTSLYAMLTKVAAERHGLVNITTIEDPIEYTIPRVSQAAVDVRVGFDFATALRALLRQDPDVIMLGEIRDRETAEIAVRTALVGRLLLSTLHTNDATGAVARLVDMGVEPFLVASTLALVIGQRLMRRLCLHCRESLDPDPAVMRGLSARPDFDATIRALQTQGVLSAAADPLLAIRLFRGRGCRQCQGSGFRGRLGVFEVFELDDEMRGLIMEHADGGTIRARAVANGMKTMLQDGLAKAFLG